MCAIEPEIEPQLQQGNNSRDEVADGASISTSDGAWDEAAVTKKNETVVAVRDGTGDGAVCTSQRGQSVEHLSLG